MDDKQPTKLNDPVFFREKIWFGLTRWMWIRLAFVFLTIAYTFNLWYVQHNYDGDIHRQKETNVSECNTFNDGRQVLRDLLVASYDQGFNLPLTELPAFQELDQPSKDYFTELESVLKNATSDSTRKSQLDQQLAKLPLRNCEEEFG